MTRARRVYSDNLPYHVTARCTHREWFHIPIEKVWEIFNNHLYFTSIAFGLRIHSFVLMSNHFHLLATTPSGNISEIMRYLMTETSREISQSAGRINQTYGGPYFSSLITKDIHYSLLFENVDSTLDWINKAYLGEAKDHIRRALRKNTFQIPSIRNSRKENPLEHSLS